MPPGSSVSPKSDKQKSAPRNYLRSTSSRRAAESSKTRRGQKLTAIDSVVDDVLDAALVALLDGLGPELGAVDVAVGVHGLLQGVALPPEDVVAVVSQALKSRQKCKQIGSI